MNVPSKQAVNQKVGFLSPQWGTFAFQRLDALRKAVARITRQENATTTKNSERQLQSGKMFIIFTRRLWPLSFSLSSYLRTLYSILSITPARAVVLLLQECTYVNESLFTFLYLLFTPHTAWMICFDKCDHACPKAKANVCLSLALDRWLLPQLLVAF